jgi:hypothetical protein
VVLALSVTVTVAEPGVAVSWRLMMTVLPETLTATLVVSDEGAEYGGAPPDTNDVAVGNAELDGHTRRRRGNLGSGTVCACRISDCQRVRSSGIRKGHDYYTRRWRLWRGIRCPCHHDGRRQISTGGCKKAYTGRTPWSRD